MAVKGGSNYIYSCYCREDLVSRYRGHQRSCTLCTLVYTYLQHIRVRQRLYSSWTVLTQCRGRFHTLSWKSALSVLTSFSPLFSVSSQQLSCFVSFSPLLSASLPAEIMLWQNHKTSDRTKLETSCWMLWSVQQLKKARRFPPEVVETKNGAKMSRIWLKFDWSGKKWDNKWKGPQLLLKIFMFNQSVSCSITCLIYKVSQNGKKSSHNPQNIQFNVTEEEINHKNIHIKEAEIREFR